MQTEVCQVENLAAQNETPLESFKHSRIQSRHLRGGEIEYEY